MLAAGVIGAVFQRQEAPLRAPSSAPITFVETTLEAGFSAGHGFKDGASTDPRQAIGGVAAGDVDGDQLVDLYIVRGDIGPNLLFLNRGDRTFADFSF